MRNAAFSTRRLSLATLAWSNRWYIVLASIGHDIAVDCQCAIQEIVDFGQQHLEFRHGGTFVVGGGKELLQGVDEKFRRLSGREPFE